MKIIFDDEIQEKHEYKNINVELYIELHDHVKKELDNVNNSFE